MDMTFFDYSTLCTIKALKNEVDFPSQHDDFLPNEEGEIYRILEPKL